MNWLKQLFSRGRLYGDLSEEIQAHLEEKVEELVGGSRGSARVWKRNFDEGGESQRLEMVFY